MTENAPRNETQVAYHRRRAQELMQIRQPWESTWRDLNDHIKPQRLRLVLKDEGPVSRKNIIDGTGTVAHRTLQSGMHSGASSPARPWFRLASEDPELTEYPPVKHYLAFAERRMREVFAKSNVYPCFHLGYGDLGLFGQSCAIMVEDDRAFVRLIQLTHGTFWIARDETGRATTLYRRFRWSVQRIVNRFGYANVSQTIKTHYNSGRYDERFDIWHAIEPRLNRNPNSPAKWNKAWLSNYWEDLGHEHKLLEESGFDRNPIIAPPWEISADDNYAMSPAMDALGDIKMLQKEQTRKLEAIDKMVRPPMTGPASMRNNPASLLPGSVTYVDDPSGKGYRPAMEVRVDLQHLARDIAETQNRIERTMYADLFLMLAQLEGVQPRNQLEILERKEEKLLALGPVLENVHGGQFEPVISNTFAILAARGELPPPPPELDDAKLNVEYISTLAQAQKAVATGTIERGFGFVGQLAAVKPDVLDKVNADEAVDIYFDYIGAPPSVVVPDDEVKKIRDARAQKQAQIDQAEMAATVAPAAKVGAEAAAVLADTQNNQSGPALLQQLGLA